MWCTFRIPSTRKELRAISLRHSIGYFAGRAVVIQRDLNELFRIGRRSLVIGASILVACFLLAHLAGDYLTETAFKGLIEESFLILGWVANWRPLEIFLYDWWPLARRRDLYNRLSVATVELMPYAHSISRRHPPCTHRSNPIMRSRAAASESLDLFRGLAEVDAQARLKAEGYNELPQPDRRTPFRIAIEVLREPMLMLLLVGGIVYLVLGDLKEAIILVAFATMSIVITVVQETRTERVLEALRDLTSPRALVIRDGQRKRIAGRDVVRGDLIVLSEGDRVPADAVLLQCQDLQADKSTLTGKSVPVRKVARNDRDESRPQRPGGDDLPQVFSGSLVVRGSGLAEVTAIGPRSEIGKIGQSLAGLETEPPRLQAQTRRLVRLFAVVGGAVSVLAVLLYGIMRGGWLDAVLAGIALGMSMLPEEFPVVLTVFMAMGAWRISLARVLTRRAAAIETLGSATVLCTDKTGTLTENRMTIVELRRTTANIFRPDEGRKCRHRSAP